MACLFRWVLNILYKMCSMEILWGKGQKPYNPTYVQWKAYKSNSFKSKVVGKSRGEWFISGYSFIFNNFGIIIFPEPTNACIACHQDDTEQARRLHSQFLPRLYLRSQPLTAEQPAGRAGSHQAPASSIIPQQFRLFAAKPQPREGWSRAQCQGLSARQPGACLKPRSLYFWS